MKGFRWVASLALLLSASGAVAQPAGNDWLILQSAADPLALVGAVAAKRAPGGRVMASSDCREMRPGLYVLAMRPGAGVRPAGAYVKRCTPRPNSLTARGIAAVDPSFAAMRSTPINFDGSDIVSTVRAGLLLRPYYAPSPEDPREGLRTAVDDVAGERRPIERDCTGPEVARSRTHIAIACAIEQVAEQYAYRTVVYRADDLARVKAISRCRKPRLMAGAVKCAAQTISADGQVTTAQRTVAL
ncbi:hypothetical protein LK533_09540 [Sphingomonas sp. PL-96]|uniref:hypothetical protein n=1 Tax=Sphingomonas sp. PL-96 TaxID=2887201 RepID=UPI001E3F032F|nr:hypothetical protein [Sphingomonas sp. PL-96]MCC2976913.1 hypothetical protein [Sphingomonas sp. PL-96]